LLLGSESELGAMSIGAYIFLRHFVVNEIIVAFLGPLPLLRHPESKPITPW